MPALLSGFIMTFSKVMGTYGGPNVLGVPVRYYTVSTMIRSNIAVGAFRGCLRAGDHPDPFFDDHDLISTKELSAPGKATRRSADAVLWPRKRNCATMKYIIAASVSSHFRCWWQPARLILLTLEHVDAQIRQLQPEQFEPGALDREERCAHQQRRTGHSAQSRHLQSSLEYDQAGRVDRIFYRAAWDRPVGYSIVKGRGTRLAKITEQLAFIPYVIPGIAFGAVYITMFSKPVGPIPPLYGTFALLVVVSVAKHIPYSSRSGVSAMLQVGRELEEAAALAGRIAGGASA